MNSDCSEAYRSNLSLCSVLIIVLLDLIFRITLLFEGKSTTCLSLLVMKKAEEK